MANLDKILEYQAIVNSPEFQNYVSSGRINIPTQAETGGKIEWALKSVKDQLAQVRGEDKRIGQYYELATGQKASPEIIAKYAQYASDPALLTAAIAKGAATMGAIGTYADSINAAIKERMGRDATEAEKQYFGKQMEQGALDLYGLGTFLEGTTEYQNKQSDVARSKLASELGAVDQEYLNKVAKQLEAQYAAQGRRGAGAFGSALIGAGKDIATQRTGYLAGLGYQDFQRGQQNLRSDYEAQLARQYANQQMGATLGQESRQRYYGQQDFARNQAAQERLMRMSQPSSGSFLQNLVPGIVGAGAQLGAAYLGRPQTTINQGWQGVPYRY